MGASFGLKEENHVVWLCCLQPLNLVHLEANKTVAVLSKGRLNLGIYFHTSLQGKQ